MGLVTITVSFLLALSMLAADQLHLKEPLQQVDHPSYSSQPSLPRKLINLNHETVKSSAQQDFTVRHEFRQASPGTKHHEKEENVAEKETWRSESYEEDEGFNKSEYFTMDYRWVRRRRPIHNKQVPFTP